MRIERRINRFAAVIIPEAEAGPTIMVIVDDQLPELDVDEECP